MRSCVFCLNSLKRGVNTCNGCRRVQPSPQLAPYFKQAISEDSSLVLGSARQKLAIRAKELKQMDKEPKKSDTVKSVELPFQKLTLQSNYRDEVNFTKQKSVKKLNSRGKIWILVIPIAILIAALNLITPSQKDSDPKGDKALIVKLFYDLNRVSSAQDQFSYIVANNYPNFLNNSIAKTCASGIKPASTNSYTPLAAPGTVEVFKIEAISKNYTTDHKYDGSFGPDNENFKGTKIVGRTYTVSVKDSLKTGGKVYSFNRDVKVTIRDGKAFWYTHYC